MGISARPKWPQVFNLRCQEAQSRKRWGPRGLRHRPGLPMPVATWHRFSTCVPRRSGLPVPRRRTLAAPILGFARSVIPLLRHHGFAEESNAGSRGTGSPERHPLLSVIPGRGSSRPEARAEAGETCDQWWNSVQPDLVNEDVDGPSGNPFKVASVVQLAPPPTRADVAYGSFPKPIRRAPTPSPGIRRMPAPRPTTRRSILLDMLLKP